MSLALSVRFKEAFKTALAMAIAYGIALSMDWDKPMWAGFAVAFVSLETVGQSMQKAAYRMAGTLLGVVAALTTIALFPQDRWLFIVFLSAYLGLCTYMMAGPRRQYFWNVAGFVCVIIAVEGGPDASRAFETAMLRSQETGLGILVYGLVAILLWPSSSGGALRQTVRGLAADQRGALQRQLAFMTGDRDTSEPPPSGPAMTQAQSRFGQLLDAAEVDTYEVWEARDAWRRCLREHASLTETLEKWPQTMAALRGLETIRLLPNLGAFAAAIDDRIAAIEGMYEGVAPTTRSHQPIELTVDGVAFRELSHFERAALTLVHDQLQQLDQLTRSLFETARGIQGFAPLVGGMRRPPPESLATALDPERIEGALRAMLTLWLGYVALIYVPTLPGGAGLVVIAGSLSMAFSKMPQIPISTLFIPIAFSITGAALLYIFLMPTLSSYLALGLMIFVVTFAICYLFAAPRQVLGRTAGLAMFVTVISISNQQSYSFLSVANTAMMFPFLFIILAIAKYFPFSTRPETVVLRLLTRFFRSCEYLTSTSSRDPRQPPAAIERLRTAFHQHEIATLPDKLASWSGFVSPAVVPAETRPHLQALVLDLKALAQQIDELVAVRDRPQAEALVQPLLQDARAWRMGVQTSLQRLAVDPAAEQPAAFQDGLRRTLERIEARIEAVLNEAPEGSVTAEEGKSFYRLLGSYRGISEALNEVTREAGRLDWARLREARF